MLSAQRRYRHPGFGLLENPNALLLGEPALSHDDGLLGLRHELTTGIPRREQVKIAERLRDPPRMAGGTYKKGRPCGLPSHVADAAMLRSCTSG